MFILALFSIKIIATSGLLYKNANPKDVFPKPSTQLISILLFIKYLALIAEFLQAA